MTCPFYVCDGRPSCALGEPDGRHCGPKQYPVSPCNLDEIGDQAWRAAVDNQMAVAFLFLWCATAVGDAWAALQYDRIIRCAVPQLLEPVGWSP